MAKEYIERDALIAHVKDLPTWWADGGGVYGKAMKYPDGAFDCEDIINSISNAPAADVVEVVRSRGCGYCQEDKDGYRRMFGSFSLINPFHGMKWQLHCGRNKPHEIKFCPMCGRRLEDNIAID